MDRSENLDRLSRQRFDLIVLGGGISGACLAYDAAKRGMRVALIEKGDFGAATSAASSKLLHGGIRYLQQARLGKVRESAFERVYFQNLVPHLCHYVPFLIPTYRELSKGRLALRAAFLAYSVACAGQNTAARLRASRVPDTRMLGGDELRRLAPILRENTDITGGAILPECHMKNSERVTLALISGAVEYGAVVANYTRAEELRHSAKSLHSIVARDTESGAEFEVRGKLVANCAGPWIGPVNERLLGKSSGPVTAYSRGAHIVVRGLEMPYALALPTTQQIEGFTDRGGRHMFLIPWRGLTLIGTSYGPQSASLDAVLPLEADIEQLLSGINQTLGQDLISRDDVIHAYAGIYPLTADQVDESTYQGTGDYVIIDHYKADGISGYFSVFGAKFTTARLLAEKACDRMVGRLERKYRPCTTRREPVPAARYGDIDEFTGNLVAAHGAITPAASIQAVVEGYGVSASEVLRPLSEQPQLGRLLCPDRETIEAEAVFSARHEMTCHLDDFVFRRSGLGTIGDPGESAILRCAELIGDELGWSPDRRRQEVDRTRTCFLSQSPACGSGPGS